MNIDHLKEFIFAAETLSFSAAARHFYLSQSVLSKHIASMEDAVGAKLFVRDSHHVRLSESGKIFLESAKAIVSEYDSALERLEALNNSYEAYARIGYLRNAAQSFLPKFLMTLTRMYPRLKLKITCMEYGELDHALATRKVDMALTVDLDKALRDLCNARTIYEDRFYAIASPHHELAKLSLEGGITQDMLSGNRILLPDKQKYPGMCDFVRSFLPDDCPQSDFSYYEDVDTLFLKVEHNQYIGFSSGHNIKAFEGRAVFLPIKDVDTSYSVSALWLKESKRPSVLMCANALEKLQLH